MEGRGELSESLRVGVIGLGFMGATHVAAYQAASRDGHPCRLVAVADPKQHRRRGQLNDVGGNLDSGSADAAFDPAEVRGHATADDLIADADVDLVSVCTRTDSHVRTAEAALRAGKHVLLEKPVAVRTADVERLADVARESKRACVPAMCMRFWPQWRWLCDRVNDGEHGPLRSLTLTRLGSRPGWSGFYADPSRCGGAILDLHVHDTDFVAALLGVPRAVTSVGTVDHVTTLYHPRGGPHAPAHVAAEGGWEHDGLPFRMRYVAAFADATADFDIGRDEPLLLCQGGKAEPVDCGPLTGYDVEIRHVVDALSAGREPDLSLDDAVTTHRILDAERRSLAERRTVELD